MYVINGSLNLKSKNLFSVRACGKQHIFVESVFERLANEIIKTRKQNTAVV